MLSATEPKVSPRSGTFQKHSGRRLLNTAPSGPGKTDEPPARVIPANATVEEIDHILEDDAFALLNIKKEISITKNEELSKLQNAVMAVKREYDNAHISNDMKEKEIKEMKNKIFALQGVDKASASTSAVTTELAENLERNNSETVEECLAEQRTIKMQTLMIKRLEDEIAHCRADIAKASVAAEQAKHEFSIIENTLFSNRQELLEHEHDLEKMQVSMKMRQDQRSQKMEMLHNLAQENENSVARLNQSLLETEKKRTARIETRRRLNSNQGGRVATARHQDEMDDDLFEEGMTDVAVQAKRLNIAEIREMVARYNSQSMRMEKLMQLDQELRNSIILEQRKKYDLTEKLNATELKIQQLASSRQVYQEVDMKDIALTAASKQCDECKDRDYRLRVNIESLKQSLPRFLTKVTKVVHPKPLENQLGDAILKLDDELTKLIKAVSVALLKDATPDDLAIISQQATAPSGQGQNADSTSEFGRLQQLPGFARMKKQLFYNLMTARPDVSEQNIRITQIGHRKIGRSSVAANTTAPITPYAPPAPRSTKKNATYQAVSLAQASMMSSNASGQGDVNQTTTNYFLELEDDDPLSRNKQEETLDRTTIKNIAKLISERDGKAKTKPGKSHKRMKKG